MCVLGLMSLVTCRQACLNDFSTLVLLLHRFDSMYMHRARHGMCALLLSTSSLLWVLAALSERHVVGRSMTQLAQTLAVRHDFFKP